MNIEALYERRFSELQRQNKQKIWETLTRHFFQRFVSPDDVVLDIGCGYGEFLNFIKAQRRIGVDASPAAGGRLAPGIEFYRADATRLDFLANESVSFVFSSNFLEHLQNKDAVDSVLREARRVLRPGGRLMLLGPNARLVPGRYWDYWDHNVPITDRSLAEALRLAGFELEEVVPAFLPYTMRQSLLPTSPLFIKAYLRMKPLWRFFGHQFLVTACAQ